MVECATVFLVSALSSVPVWSLGVGAWAASAIVAGLVNSLAETHSTVADFVTSILTIFGVDSYGGFSLSL